ERDNLYRLLLQAGRLRSQLLQLNVEQGDGHAIALSEQYFSDVGREVRIVPYHLLAAFYTKLLEFRQHSISGLEGWLYIANQAGLLLVALAFPFVIYYLLRRFSEYLSRLRRALVRGEIRSKHSKWLAISIQRLNPYVPWVVMLLGLGALAEVMAGSVFAELGVVLPYLAYYFWYRIFLLLLSSLVAMVAQSGAVEVGYGEKVRIAKVARQIGIFFVTALAILHATEDVVGKALVYRIVSDVIFYVGTVVCAYGAWQWRIEIAGAGERVLPRPLAVRMPLLQRGWRAWLFSLPALLMVVVARLIEFLLEWASEFDFFKRLGAELFRRRIEGNDTAAAAPPQSTALPEDYLAWFELEKLAQPDVFIVPDNSVVEDVKKVVQSWSQEQAGEHSLVLYGDKGGGKTTLLQLIKNSVTGVEVRSIIVPPKLCTRAAVMQFFGAELRVDLSENADALIQASATMPKTMIMIDEAHNLFLAKLGGFEGYRAFVELVNLPTENLFWCATFNRRSWRYLNGVFGGSQQFRKVIKVPSFSDQDIQKMIMVRHAKTAYRLAYDEIIRATQSDDDHIGVTAVETQFFRLLWGQSNGNPCAAMALWLASLRSMPGNKLRVGVPRYQPVKGLEQAGDDAWFVYAEILRHDSISVNEAMQTTNLSEGVVRGAIKIGLEARALAVNANGRFHVTPNAQSYLNQLLARKNFIYE
ncbi:MAG: ATP-binding protein, partial [Pseudomonadota bacterium]|nr:ATP-binding protein [Pseudomonadota bacterium]